jgi:hypothetical protein
MDPEKNRPEIHRSGVQKKQEENGSNWQKEIPDKVLLREQPTFSHKIYLEDQNNMRLK